LVPEGTQQPRTNPDTLVWEPGGYLRVPDGVSKQPTTREERNTNQRKRKKGGRKEGEGKRERTGESWKEKTTKFKSTDYDPVPGTEEFTLVEVSRKQLRSGRCLLGRC